MITGHNLDLAMREFFDRLDGFELANDEAFTLAAMPYPECLEAENGCAVVRRCQDAWQASRVALWRLGPACELYVAIAKAESPLDTPAGPDAVIVGCWRMRERTKAESDLGCTTWVVQGSRPNEPLMLSGIHPAGYRLVCEATIWYLPRYREIGVAEVEKVWRDRVNPRRR